MNRKTLVLPVAAVVVGLLVGVGAGVAKANLSFRDALLERSSKKLVASLLSEPSAEVSEAPEEPLLGGGVQNVEEIFDNGLKAAYVKWRDSNSEMYQEEWLEFLPLTSASSSVSWKQKYEGIVEVQVEYLLQGSASATMKFAAGTSTIANAPEWNASLTANSVVPQGLIPVQTISTGTPYKEVLLQSSSLLGYVFSTSAKATSTWARMPQGEYVTGFRTTGGSDALHGSSATSTAGSGLLLDNSWLLIHVRRAATTTRSGT